MKYLCLLYADESLWKQMSKEEQQKGLGEHWKYTDAIMKSGHFLGGHALQNTNTAVTVRVRNRDLVITDGPFMETKEQLGGYYLLEAADIHEAIQLASKNPGSHYGSIEVRPVWEIPLP